MQHRVLAFLCQGRMQGQMRVNSHSDLALIHDNEVIHESRIYERNYVLRTTPSFGTHLSDMVLHRLMAI